MQLIVNILLYMVLFYGFYYYGYAAPEPDYFTAFTFGFVIVNSFVIMFVPGLHASKPFPGQYPD